jgi:Mrp family chromosome partitioning ATPase
MDVAFLISAVRRYYWVIALGALLGALPALLLAGRGPDGFESRAVILVAPPTESDLQVSFEGDPDRYVAGQLSVLTSQALAEQAAELLGEGYDRGDVTSAIRIEQAPLTDVVSIIATTPDAKRSQAIADAYIQAYLAQLNAQLESTQQPQIERLDLEIAAVRAEIDEVDQQMVDVMAPYLGRNPIPSIEQIAPGLVSEKAILLNEYTELQATRTELSSGLRVATAVVQPATLPTEPLASPTKTLLAMGLLGGAFFGLIAAVVIARLSPTVIGDDQAEEILGTPVVGSFPVLPSVTGHRSAVIGTLPSSAAWFVESLCVRVESAAEGRGAVAVVVTGTQSRSGSTTVAAALARGFTAPRSRVLLVDADPRQPELTDLFIRNARRSPWARADASPGDDAGSPEREMLATTAVPNLRVTSLGLLTELSLAGVDDGSRAARRPDMARLLATAWQHADVLVFDGGPLMSSVATVQLTRLCDAVVLAMPKRQQVRGLEIVAAELRSHQHLLPLWTPAGGRRHARRRPPREKPVPPPEVPAETPAVTAAPAPAPASRGWE